MTALSLCHKILLDKWDIMDYVLQTILCMRNSIVIVIIFAKHTYYSSTARLSLPQHLLQLHLDVIIGI